MKDWKAWALLIVLFLLVKMCGGCNGCDSSDDNSSGSYDSEEAPSWIQGEWKCITPYGNMEVEIAGNHIREDPYDDGTIYSGTYHIDGDYIISETGSHIHYQMDKSSRRLVAGQGYYFEKK